MHAVILAAGDGGRLHPHTAGVPKPLLTLGGRPILNHVLDALDDGGVSDATVVVGYHGDQIRRALADLAPRGMRIGFAENPDYLLGNARSIWAARAAVAAAPGFLLAMGDHLVEPSMVAALAAGAAARCRLAIDRAAPADPRAAEAHWRASATAVSSISARGCAIGTPSTPACSGARRDSSKP
jgi:NDP-sugar pyrophosphorylase family protein